MAVCKINFFTHFNSVVNLKVKSYFYVSRLVCFYTDIVSVIQDSDNYILSEAKDGINFLNGREEFWKQQKLIN